MIDVHDAAYQARVDQANDWLLRLMELEVSDQELARWLDWCADSANLREFQRARQMWRTLGRIGPTASELLETLMEMERSRVVSGINTVRSVPRPWRKLSIAASVAIASATVWWVLDRGGFFSAGGRYVANASIENAVLPDGSDMTLAPMTKITTHFSEDQRGLAFTKGEAYFKVRPDKAKRFVVHAQGVSITALGTAFSVRSESDEVTVTVQEGVVEVSAQAGADAVDGNTWRVRAGSMVAYSIKQRSARIETVDPARELAWRTGRLEYFTEPLAGVVADISRYSARRIEIDDPHLARLEFTGTVNISSIDDWLAALASAFPVRVMTQGERTVLLSREPKRSDLSSEPPFGS